jgi:intracellular septation protein
MTSSASRPEPSPVRRHEPRWLKPASDYGPLAVFFLVYLSQGLIPATAALIAATAVALAVTLIIARRVPLLPLITAAVVGIFGGLTLWFNDETFIKMKPTIVQAIIGALLLGGLAFGRSLLKPVMGASWSMDDAGWRKLSLRFGLFFLAMALLNEVVWRTQSTDFWVNFKVFGLLGLTLVFSMAQVPLLQRHQLPIEPGSQTKS